MFCVRCKVPRGENQSYLCESCVEVINSRKSYDNKFTDKIIYGLLIMRQYGPVSCSCGHDEFYAGPNEGSVSEADRKLLTDREKGLKWHWNEEFDCFGFFT